MDDFFDIFLFATLSFPTVHLGQPVSMQNHVSFFFKKIRTDLCCAIAQGWLSVFIPIQSDEGKPPTTHKQIKDNFNKR
jgi:hypothetical protein